MSATMKALVYYAPHDIRVESVPVPTSGADEVRVKVDACAVCGTDLKSYLFGNPRIEAPMIIGHEFTGLVDRVGDAVEGFASGDRVVMATSLSCGECFYCDGGWGNLCLDLAPVACRYPGGMAEYVVIPERALRNGHAVKVPAGIPAEHAALAEPLSCAVNCAENCGIRPGDTVLVIGAGPMGILNACVAREFGAEKIILAEVNDLRLGRGREFGIDFLVNPAQEDLRQFVRDATEGRGADVAIVAAPAAPPQEDAVHLVRKRGTVCLFASLPPERSPLTLDSRAIHYGELRVVGSSDSAPRHVERAVELIARSSFPADRLISHRLELTEILSAFRLMQSGEALKVVLRP